MNKPIVLLLTFVSILILGARIYKSIEFNMNCGGHLKRAADANTIDLAKSELRTAIVYLENNNLTSGYTSIIYKTPDEDIGFWYQNLLQSYYELDQVTPETSQLEKTNLLMKLRETLLDNSESGDMVTCPDGISAYPMNLAWAVLCWLAFIGLFGLPLLLLL